jgi:hypothetical protein
MYTICSRFAICSFRALGTGPFPKPLVPFDSLGWPLLENTPNNKLNVISMTAYIDPPRGVGATECRT